MEAGKSIATVESSKWVGPVRTPAAGEIIAVNEKVEEDPSLINKSPYNDGWVARLKCDDMETPIGRRKELPLIKRVLVIVRCV